MLRHYKRNEQNEQTLGSARFKIRNQAPTEDVDEYLAALDDMRTLGFPDDNTTAGIQGMSAKDREVQERFVDGLLNKALQASIRTGYLPHAANNRWNLDNLMNFVHMQMISPLVGCQECGPKADHAGAVCPKRTRPAKVINEAFDDDDTVMAISHHYAPGPPQLHRYPTNPQRPPQGYARPPQRQFDPAMPRTMDGAPIECWNCKGPHFRSKCPFPIIPTPTQGPPQERNEMRQPQRQNHPAVDNMSLQQLRAEVGRLQPLIQSAHATGDYSTASQAVASRTVMTEAVKRMEIQQEESCDEQRDRETNEESSSSLN
jgi:hypothetical protein